QRVVAILDRQRSELRRSALHSRSIGLLHIAGQRLHRPAIAGNVVQHQQKHVCVLCALCILCALCVPCVLCVLCVPCVLCVLCALCVLLYAEQPGPQR